MTEQVSLFQGDSKPRHVFVDRLVRHIGETVVVNGWLQTVRRTKKLRFLVIKDRTGSVQTVYRNEAPGDDKNGLEIDAQNPECALRIVGQVREPVSAKFGKVEIEIHDIAILSTAETPLPLDRKTTPDSRLDNRFLDLRTRENFLVFEVRSTFEHAVREFLIDRAFIDIHTPKISAGGSESGAALFEVPYFEQNACLVQSPQFYVQMAMAAGFDRVFEIGPVFRAEPSVSNRHATEFTCIDVEMSWIETLDDLMDFEEALLRHAFGRVRDAHGEDIARHCGVEVTEPVGPAPRIPYAEAQKLTADISADDTGRLTHRAEQALSKHALDEYGSSFVFLTEYPAEHRPFYTKRIDGGEHDPSLSFDLLWGGMEITSGCIREHRYEHLRRQAHAADLKSETQSGYLDDFYLEMFRYGCPPHGGFGIGVERVAMALLAKPSVRDTSFVFRGPGRLVP